MAVAFLVVVLFNVPTFSSSLLSTRDSQKRQGSPIEFGRWDYEDHGISWHRGHCHMSWGQSPIALPSGARPDGSELLYSFRTDSPISAQLSKDGRILSIAPRKCAGGFRLRIPGARDENFSLTRVVLHAPSEHLWTGARLPLEAQLIHQSVTNVNESAVISIGFSRGVRGAGVQYPLLASLLNNGSLPRATVTELNTTLQFTGLLGPEVQMLSYTGSTTTPDCTPGTKWFVRQEPIEVSTDIVDSLTNSILRMTHQVGNFRVKQPLGNRNVTIAVARNASVEQGAGKIGCYSFK